MNEFGFPRNVCLSDNDLKKIREAWNAILNGLGDKEFSLWICKNKGEPIHYTCHHTDQFCSDPSVAVAAKDLLSKIKPDHVRLAEKAAEIKAEISQKQAELEALDPLLVPIAETLVSEGKKRGKRIKKGKSK